ncbi:MAG: hypothetical protein WCC38_10150 [Pseudonocardiaceae bacterium]
MTGRTQMWTVGEWAPAETRTAAVKDRQVTVFGHCAATDTELHGLAAHGVTDRVLTRFAGSYTVVESTAHRTTVFTDPGSSWPIYTAGTADDILWGSSALALAALTHAQPDIEWLARALLAPDRPELLAGRSAFTGITSVTPGANAQSQPVEGASTAAPAAAKQATADVTPPPSNHHHHFLRPAPAATPPSTPAPTATPAPSAGNAAPTATPSPNASGSAATAPTATTPSLSTNYSKHPLTTTEKRHPLAR